MKTAYIAYKFKGTDPKELKAYLEELSKVVEESLECKTFIFFRDMQNWGKIEMDIKEVVDKASESVGKCDFMIIEASEKANGVYFETGYAKALEKKIIVIHKTGTEANFLESAADVSIEYENWDDLRDKLGDVNLGKNE
jgi:nucleoside 2-deoxyribosyltransferase